MLVSAVLELGRVLVHLDGEGVAGLDAAAACDRALVNVATDIVAHDILDRGVGLRQAHADLAVLRWSALLSIERA